MVELKCQLKGFGHLEGIGKPQTGSVVRGVGLVQLGKKCDMYDHCFGMTHLTTTCDRSERRGGEAWQGGTETDSG